MAGRNYIVDYDKLHKYCKKTSQQTKLWIEELADIQAEMEKIQNTKSIAGTGADNIRSYFTNAHGVLIQSMQQLIYMHEANCKVYYKDYVSNVDGDLHAHIEKKVLDEVQDKVNGPKKKTSSAAKSVAKIAVDVSDLVSLESPSASAINEKRAKVSHYIDTLRDAFLEQEDRHYAYDFSESIPALRNTLKLIKAMKTSRTYPSEFDLNAFAQSAEFTAFLSTAVAVQETVNANQEIYLDADQTYNAREEALVHEREQKMEIVKVSVLVVTTAASLAVTVVTGGAASPLLMASVSAMTAATNSVTNDLADTYVKDGDLEDLDSGQVLRNAGKSAAIGFLSSCVGSAVSGVTSDGLTSIVSRTGIYNNPANSSMYRWGADIIIGSTTEVVKGASKRFTSEFLNDAVTVDKDGIHIEDDPDEMKKIVRKSVNEAGDTKEIAIDAATGGADAMVDTEKTIKEAKHRQNIDTRERNKIERSDEPMDYDDTYREKRPYTKSEKQALDEVHESGDFDRDLDPSPKSGKEYTAGKKSVPETERKVPSGLSKESKKERVPYKVTTRIIDTADSAAEKVGEDVYGVDDKEDRWDIFKGTVFEDDIELKKDVEDPESPRKKY